MQTNGTTLEQRLAKSHIDLDEFADLMWKRIKPKVIGMLDHMAKQRAADRQALLVAAVTGLMVGWNTECSAQRVAEIAERVVDAVMREEAKRSK